METAKQSMASPMPIMMMESKSIKKFENLKMKKIQRIN
jgi:hypothetical protein